MANRPVIAQRYQIEREIGRGGAGVVYAVKHVHTGERLAMKVLLSHAVNQPDIVQRFRREMQASARVRSEHVVRITDADIAPELDGAPFLVMELLNGTDLGRLVVERGACPKEETIWILSQAARGLDRAHAAGIVHRELFAASARPRRSFQRFTAPSVFLGKPAGLCRPYGVPSCLH